MELIEYINYSQNNKKQIRAIVVERSAEDLPAEINSWDKVVIKSERVSRTDRYINYNETLFRQIANAFDNLQLTPHKQERKKHIQKNQRANKRKQQK